MIVVRVELWPGGAWDRAKTLSVAAIANASQRPAGNPTYVAVTTDEDGTSGEFAIVDHTRGQGAWGLVRAVADQVLGSAGTARPVPVPDKYTLEPGDLRDLLSEAAREQSLRRARMERALTNSRG